MSFQGDSGGAYFDTDHVVFGIQSFGEPVLEGGCGNNGSGAMSTKWSVCMVALYL